MASDVFILGAGFSKKVSERMPLMNELSQAIASDLPQTKAVPFMQTDVEMAMTFLAQPQPWMTQAERLRNRAMFLDIAQAIASKIDQLSGQVQACPGWLLKFVHWLHFHKAVVITLNYDTLLESAICAISGGQCYPKRLIPFRFAASEGALGDFNSWDSLELLKLHGSTNWRYSGRDSYSGELIQWSDIRSFRKPDEVFKATKKMDGSFPLVIPPVTEKAGYFAHHCIEHVWRRASQALAVAPRIYCLGYSLPATDLTIRFLLSDLSRQEPAEFYLVNRPSRVEHFRNILPKEHYRVRDRFVGAEPIPSFVDALFTEEFLPTLPTLNTNRQGPVQTAIRDRIQEGRKFNAFGEAGAFAVTDFQPNSVTLLVTDASVPAEEPIPIPIRITWEVIEEICAIGPRTRFVDWETRFERHCHRSLGRWLGPVLEAAGLLTVWSGVSTNIWFVSPPDSDLDEIAAYREQSKLGFHGRWDPIRD